MRRATSVSALFSALTNISARANQSWSRESLMWMREKAKTDTTFVQSILKLAVYTYKSQDSEKTDEKTPELPQDTTKPSDDPVVTVMSETRFVYRRLMGAMGGKGHLQSAREFFELEVRRGTSKTGILRALANISERASQRYPSTWSRESIDWMAKKAETDTEFIQSILRLAAYTYRKAIDGRPAAEAEETVSEEPEATEEESSATPTWKEHSRASEQPSEVLS